MSQAKTNNDELLQEGGLATKYEPHAVENRWYAYWMEHRLFHSEPDDREPFTIVIPPPNVTGVLHMGHMLNNTIQDILVRRARMEGKNALWVPGTDHAAISTEAKVVAKLAAEGVKKTDLTREQFLDHAWDWTHKYGGIILEQLKKLGASCDWERTAFTMDEIRSKSVIRVFVELYRKGLVYRGVRMVNWDPQALTALSDEEVIYKEEQSKLYHLKYKVENDPEGRYIVVATTRPETILGDTAVCVNPNDERYTWLKGKRVIVPMVGRSVPVIMDEYVEMDFGTGCLKVTPAHDVNDYMLGDKYGLESIDIFNDNGTISEQGGMYVGMDRFDVRKQIMIDLAQKNLVEKVEDYVNKVGHSERTDAVIEPKLSMQWFVKMDELARPALDGVENDEIRYVPPKFKNLYRHWMTNIKDWCISRQLWWGHRIPAYFLPEGGFVVAENDEEALQLAIEKSGNPALTLSDLKRDPDCLDTWFSSWLWPISLFNGILEPDNKEINYYYPTSDLVTAPDIIFFWVARMIMAGYEFMGKKPFGNVYFTGIVRDKIGRKMSKSLGNSPDPLDLIDKFGADGVRMGLMLGAPAGQDIMYDDSLCEQGRNFCNKIWNAFRLVKGWNVDETIDQPQTAHLAIEWFEATMQRTLAEVEDLMGKFRISEALMATFKLFRDEFSSWYLEVVKPAYGAPIDGKTYKATLDFFDILLRMLHPFMPFITEELWQHLADRKEGESIMYAQLPKSSGYDASKITSFDLLKEVIAGIRTIRLKRQIPNRNTLTLQVTGNRDTKLDSIIIKMGNLDGIEAVTEKSPTSASFIAGSNEYSIPLEDNIDKDEERRKLEAELKRYEGFLTGVKKKLSNEKFVANAPEAVVALERKKESDATSKLAAIRAALEAL
ncbi:MAG: valine--tRNA ligase [Prevotella sp.]|nr:valine--tRNA ligase [Bacteroides sp.]MCM1366814.1 valine--tRNA ligase [Prevotella sp.]MCM1437395.1 valine--tRNA ligase [Prevotella sp.]